MKSLITILLSGLLFGASAQAANVSGFVDAQYNWASGSGGNGFFVNDGAVYMNGSAEGVMFMVDIPFNAAGATNNTFNIATGKAQAYVSKKYSNGLEWTLGQFDTIYGYELNDTKDITFTSQGLTFARALPTTHTGLMLAYMFSEAFGVKALISNPNNTGQLGGANFEYGTMISYAMGSMNFGLGFLYNKAATDDYLLNILFGIKAGALAFDVEFDLKDTTQSGYALMGHIVYSLNNMTSVGTRFDFVSKITNHQEIGSTTGIQRKMSKALTAKLDYTLTSTKATSGGTSTTGHSISLGAVHTF